jgi:hypothetical protein
VNDKKTLSFEEQIFILISLLPFPLNEALESSTTTSAIDTVIGWLQMGKALNLFLVESKKYIDDSVRELTISCLNNLIAAYMHVSLF